MSRDEVQQIFTRAINFSAAGKSDSSQHGTDVQSAARKEAVLKETIILTKEGFTPGMRAQCVQPHFIVLENWRDLRDKFHTSIQPYRATMEAETSPAIRQRKIEENSDAETAKIRAQALQEEKYASAVKEKEQAQAAYEGMVDRAGRQARTFPDPLYLALLISIGAVEWLVNASTFQANWGIPALAAGFTIVVAGAVAAAAHEHGTVFKQREHWFGDHVSPQRRRWEIVKVLLATAALIIVLVWVGLERYQWGATEVARLGLGDENRNLLGNTSSITINVPQKVMMSLFANILVWLLGSAVAYWTHDPDPEFAQAKIRRDKAIKIFQRLHAPLAAKVRALEADRDRQLGQLSKLSTAEADVFTQIRNWEKQISEHEENLLKTLASRSQRLVEEYQHFFCSHALANNASLNINKNGQVLPVGDYQNVSLSVNADMFRRAVS